MAQIRVCRMKRTPKIKVAYVVIRKTTEETQTIRMVKTTTTRMQDKNISNNRSNIN